MPTRDLLLVLALSLLSALAAWAQPPALTLSTARPGNLFPADTRPVLQAHTTAAVLTWQVTDYDGQSVGAGEAAVEAGAATITLPALPHGYYEVVAHAGADSSRLCLGMITDHSGQTPPPAD